MQSQSGVTCCDRFGGRHDDHGGGENDLPFCIVDRPACSPNEAVPACWAVGTDLSPHVRRTQPSPLREGRLMEMPEDLWHLIMTYLPISDAMALRGTSVGAHKHLKVVTDAILDGCRMIDRRISHAGPESTSAWAEIDTLQVLRLEARCDILRRYAKHVGLLIPIGTARADTSNMEPRWALEQRYFAKRSAVSGTTEGQIAQSWRRIVDTTKAALRDVTFDMSQSIALTDVYAAEMYAPLLGIVADPYAHTQGVMDDASATLSTLRWMDFLYALGPIKEICVTVAGAYKDLAQRIDRRFPIPPVNVLAAIAHASMTFTQPQSTRQLCLTQIGIAPEWLAAHITPRVTQTIVDELLYSVTIRGFDIPWHLNDMAKRWDEGDSDFPTCLHQSFLTALARKAYRETIPWSSLTEAVCAALRTRLLGISPCDNASYGLRGRTIFDFWGLYFEVTDPYTPLLSPRVEARIDALPWPLQATLWRLAAEVHSNPYGAIKGHINPVFYTLWAKRVDIVCKQALLEGMPHFAVSALLAVLRWQLTRACESTWQNSEVDATTKRMTRPPLCPVFSPPAWSILEACTVLQRLPILAALFSYRALLMKCGYEWQFEAMMVRDMGLFMCDPASRLICPSDKIVLVLLHYLPMFRERLPEFVHGPETWKSRFAHRFGIPPNDVARVMC